MWFEKRNDSQKVWIFNTKCRLPLLLLLVVPASTSPRLTQCNHLKKIHIVMCKIFHNHCKKKILSKKGIQANFRVLFIKKSNSGSLKIMYHTKGRECNPPLCSRHLPLTPPPTTLLASCEITGSQPNHIFCPRLHCCQLLTEIASQFRTNFSRKGKEYTP